MIINSYYFKNSNKTITAHKDCKKCIYIDVCKFHQIQKESNEKIKELNGPTSLKTFEELSCCRYFIHQYNRQIKNKELVGLDSDHTVIDYIIRHNINTYIKQKLYDEYKQYCINQDVTIEDFFRAPTWFIDLGFDTVHISISTNQENTLKKTEIYNEKLVLSNMLSDWKYVSK